MERSAHSPERRKYPRFFIDLPLEYQIASNLNVHGGLVVNANQTGLLLYSIGDLPVGARLNITVLFPKGYELASFEVTGEIIWKRPDPREGCRGNQYGLNFIQIGQDDRWKLSQVLNGRFNSEGMATINEVQTGRGMTSSTRPPVLHQGQIRE